MVGNILRAAGNRRHIRPVRAALGQNRQLQVIGKVGKIGRILHIHSRAADVLPLGSCVGNGAFRRGILPAHNRQPRLPVGSENLQIVRMGGSFGKVHHLVDDLISRAPRVVGIGIVRRMNGRCKYCKQKHTAKRYCHQSVYHLKPFLHVESSLNSFSTYSLFQMLIQIRHVLGIELLRFL